MHLLLLWRHGLVVNTIAQLHSTKSKLRLCTGSNPAHVVSEICDGETLWQRSQLLNAFRRSNIRQKNLAKLFSRLNLCNYSSWNIPREILQNIIGFLLAQNQSHYWKQKCVVLPDKWLALIAQNIPNGENITLT